MHSVKRLRLTVKKVLIAAERREARKREQPLLNPERLVFIDETWAKTNMTRPRGRAPRGERLLAGVPHGYWKTTRGPSCNGSDGPTGCGWGHQR